MAVWYLVIIYIGGGVAVMPEPFYSLEECQKRTIEIKIESSPNYDFVRGRCIQNTRGHK